MKLPLKVNDEGANGFVLVDADGSELVRFDGDALAVYLSRVLANYAPLLVAATDALTFIQLNVHDQPAIVRELSATLDNALGDDEG